MWFADGVHPSDETWRRLLEWTSGQAASERLSAQILRADGFTDIDPSHPLGGKDNKKDAVAYKDGIRFIMAAYFPRGQQTFGEIKNKFQSDATGIDLNHADGIAFVTNQELRLSECEDLKSRVSGKRVELYQL